MTLINSSRGASAGLAGATAAAAAELSANRTRVFVSVCVDTSRNRPCRLWQLLVDLEIYATTGSSSLRRTKNYRPKHAAQGEGREVGEGKAAAAFPQVRVLIRNGARITHTVRRRIIKTTTSAGTAWQRMDCL